MLFPILTDDVEETTVNRTKSQPVPSKKRRILWRLFIIQLFLLLLLFPLLIIYFENNRISQQPTQVDEAGLPVEPKYFSYIDGLYWSLVTPVAVNSAEEWPQTGRGWLLVRLSDATKVLTVGVTAGLLHDSVIVRKGKKLPRTLHQRSRRLEDEEGPIEFEVKQHQVSTTLQRQRPLLYGQRRIKKNNGTSARNAFGDKGDDDDPPHII